MSDADFRYTLIDVLGRDAAEVWRAPLELTLFAPIVVGSSAAMALLSIEYELGADVPEYLLMFVFLTVMYVVFVAFTYIAKVAREVFENYLNWAKKFLCDLGTYLKSLGAKTNIDEACNLYARFERRAAKLQASIVSMRMLAMLFVLYSAFWIGALSAAVSSILAGLWALLFINLANLITNASSVTQSVFSQILTSLSKHVGSAPKYTIRGLTQEAFMSKIETVGALALVVASTGFAITINDPYSAGILVILGFGVAAVLVSDACYRVLKAFDEHLENTRRVSSEILYLTLQLTDKVGRK